MDFEIHSPESNKQYFCYLIVQDRGTKIFGYVYFTIILFYLYYIYTQFKRLNRMIASPIIAGIYYLMLLWGILTTILIFYTEALYQQISDIQQNNYNDEMKQKISKQTFLGFFLVMGQAYLISTIILITPYNWHKNFIEVLKYRNMESFSEVQSLLHNKELQKQIDYKLTKAIGFFLRLRVVLFFLWWVFLFIFVFLDHPLKNGYTIMTYFLALLDATVILVSFVMGLFSIFRNKKLHQLLFDQELRSVKIKYILLSITALVRFMVFLLRNDFIGSPIKGIFMRQQCKVLTQFNERAFYSLLVQALLMDFFSIILIQMIFHISKELVRQNSRGQNAQR